MSRGFEKLLIIGVPDTPVTDDAEPISVVLRRLRADVGISAENLAFEARNYLDEGLSTSLVTKIETEKRRATVEIMEALAAALDVPPDTFAEYRLAMLRRMFDEREVGLAQALENARELAHGLEDGGLPAPPGELGRRLTAESPNESDPQPASTRRRTRPAARRRKLA